MRPDFPATRCYVECITLPQDEVSHSDSVSNFCDSGLKAYTLSLSINVSDWTFRSSYLLCTYL